MNNDSPCMSQMSCCWCCYNRVYAHSVRCVRFCRCLIHDDRIVVDVDLRSTLISVAYKLHTIHCTFSFYFFWYTQPHTHTLSLLKYTCSAERCCAKCFLCIIIISFFFRESVLLETYGCEVLVLKVYTNFFLFTTLFLLVQSFVYRRDCLLESTLFVHACIWFGRVKFDSAFNIVAIQLHKQYILLFFLFNKQNV